MLLNLTYQCEENCTHCMNSSKPVDTQMSDETLIKVGYFINDLGPVIIHVSGGEFTLASNFDDKIIKLIDTAPKAIFSLASNGSFINDIDRTKRVKRLLDHPKVIDLQISSHKKYYPNYNKTVANKSLLKALSDKVNFVIDWQGENGRTSIKYLGRAQNLDFEIKGHPSCSLIMTISSQSSIFTNPHVPIFVQLLGMMMERGKVCTPNISPEGKLIVGESRYCTIFGDINDYDGDMFKFSNTLMNNLFKIKFCNKCKTKYNIDSYILNKLNL
jgi:hypothetical protein